MQRLRPLVSCLSLLLPLLLGAAAPASGAETPTPEADAPAGERKTVHLPRGDLFEPLLADPKEPRTFGAWVFSSTDDPTFGSPDVGLAGFGDTWGLTLWPGAREGDGLQLSISGGVFAQFNMDTPSRDLINADYVIGIPLTWRRGSTSARLRLYHQSSHLGDEFLLAENPERLNLSFESLELLVSRNLGFWRVYGGGEYFLNPEPESLQELTGHAGVEYRHPARLVDFGRFGDARFVAALDVKSSETQDWREAVSFKTGLEVLAAGQTEADPDRSWSLLLEAFDGPAPYSQFFTLDVSWWGLGIQLGL